MKKTVVYILSTPYAGSHFLSLMLGSNSRSMHIGEVSQLGRPDLMETRRRCHICGDKDCPVLSGIDQHNIHQIYDVIFGRIDPKVEVLVDNSKPYRGWADRFLDDSKYQRKYIHLIRDPRALVRRWMTKNPPEKQRRDRWKTVWKLVRAHPGLAPSIIRSDLSFVYMYQWLIQNERITRFIQQNNVDANIVTYHDLAKETPRELKRLTEWIGLEYQATQLEYWNFQHHGTQKPEYEWVKEAKTTQHFDARWKTFLKPEVATAIAANPASNDYLAKLGVKFVADGLTRTSPESPYKVVTT